MNPKSCSWVAALMASLGTTFCIQAASTIQFTAPSYTVAGSAVAVTLTVQRTGVGVDYAAANGTATNGLNYAAVSLKAGQSRDYDCQRRLIGGFGCDCAALVATLLKNPLGL